MTQRILVTGAGGFIGGYIVDEAIARGYETWAGVRKSTSHEYLTDERITFVDLDYGHPERLRSQLLELKARMGGWDYIIHNLGATKCRDKRDFMRINHDYVRNFVDALIACDMVPQKFVYMSSLSAWGKGDEKHHTPIKLTDTPCPDTAYGKSKFAAEEYLQSLPDFPYIVLRPTGVYGPRERDYYLMMKTIKGGFDFGVGYSKQLITFIYVKDLVQAIFAAATATVSRRAYFISEERAYTSQEFRRYVAAALGKRCVVPVVIPCWMLWVITGVSEVIMKLTGKTYTLNRDKYRIMCQRNWVCDTSATREELGFVPQYDLERGVNEAVAWYKEHGWL